MAENWGQRGEGIINWPVYLLENRVLGLKTPKKLYLFTDIA